MVHFVTGATGFIGSHLVDELLRRGERVRCLIRKTSDLSHLQKLPVELVYGDLTNPNLEFVNFLEQVGVVYHLAGAIRARNDDVYKKVNVLPTQRLYQAFKKAAPSEGRFLFCSSLAAAGPSPDGEELTEEAPLSPRTGYGRSKRDAEVLLQSMSGPALTIIRPPVVYGPRDRETFIFFKAAAKGFHIYIGKPDRTLTMVHVRDVVQAMIRSTKSQQGIGTFFLSDGNIYSFKNIGETFEALTGKRLTKVSIPPVILTCAATGVEVIAKLFNQYPQLNREKVFDLTAKAWVCSDRSARQKFGYAPIYNLSLGIKDTYAWYQGHGWI